MIETSSSSQESPLSIEAQFQQILRGIEQQTWTFQSLMEALQGKGYPLLIAFLSLPFCFPLQIPGLSTPFGLVISLFGLRMASGRDVWSPRILKKQISPRVLRALINKNLWLFKILKPFFKKRWSRLCTEPLLCRSHGCLTLFLGLNLALPLPIPLGNFFFAWPLLFLGLGLTENDGRWVCLSYFVALVGTCLFISLLFLFFSSFG